MNPKDMGKLNVGRMRYANEVMDEQLLREALEALKPCLAYVEGSLRARSYESDRDAINRVRFELERSARVAITKLEERLLRE